jgi:hypothetical protein
MVIEVGLAAQSGSVLELVAATNQKEDAKRVSDEKLREAEIEIQSVRRESEIALSEKENKGQNVEGNLSEQLSQIEALSNGNDAKLCGAELEIARVPMDSETAPSEKEKKTVPKREGDLSEQLHWIGALSDEKDEATNAGDDKPSEAEIEREWWGGG